MTGTIFVDKTPYIEQLEKTQPDYRYMFLRPHRFGKSAFLNMLCEYYDIHNAGIFNELFGPLYIGKHPTAWRNKHLVLKFDLSPISVNDSIDEMKTSFNKVVNGVLTDFVVKYGKELRYPGVTSVIDSDSGSGSLTRVLVRYCYTCYDKCIVLLISSFFFYFKDSG